MLVVVSTDAIDNNNIENRDEKRVSTWPVANEIITFKIWDASESHTLIFLLFGVQLPTCSLASMAIKQTQSIFTFMELSTHYKSEKY